MRTIRLTRAMSSKSTIKYRGFLNRYVRGRLGAVPWRRWTTHPFDFGEIDRLKRAGARYLAQATPVTSAELQCESLAYAACKLGDRGPEPAPNISPVSYLNATNDLPHSHRRFVNLVVVVAAVAVAGCSQASATTATNPEEASAVAPVSSGDAAAGQAVIAKTCNSCHPNANAGMGPRLYGAQFGSRYPDDAAVAAVIRRGKGGMPAFSTAQLSDQDIDDVIAYLRGLSSGAVSAEPTPTPRPRQRGD